MEPITITIALEDDSRGYEITPSRVPIDELIQFAKDVKDFIQGTDREVSKDELEISVEKGSLAIVSPPLQAPKLGADLQKLVTSFDTSTLDAKRRAVVEGWQKSSKSRTGRSFKILSSSFPGKISITTKTNFRQAAQEHWVEVERYVRGELQEMGGVKSTNAHLRMQDGKSLTIKTDKHLIRAQSENHVYHDVTIRIRAKLNLSTGELRDAELIEFVNYAPRYDDKQFKKMTAKGKKSWAEVEDPAQWVRELRGSD